MQPRTVGYIFSGAGHLALIALGLATFAFAPKKVELLDSIPVEIVTELPSESKQGVKTGEKAPEVKKQVDKIAEIKPVVEEDDDDEPIAKEKVKTADSAPPPPPVAKAVVTPPKPVEKVVAPPPPPKPVEKPKPTPPKVAALESDNLEDKLAEIEAAKKKQEQVEKQKQAKLKAEKEAREEEENERKAEEKAEKLKADQLAKAKAEKDAKAKSEKDAKAEKDAKEAKERDTKERLDRLKANKFDPNAIAAKSGSGAPTNDQRTATRTEKTGAAVAPKSTQGTATGRAAQLTSNELDGLKGQIAKCWSPPSLVQNAKSLVVAVEFSMTQDGYVSGTPSVANRQAGAEFNAAAGAAIRAVQRCQPYKLPVAKYDSWRDIRVNFRPEDLM